MILFGCKSRKRRAGVSRRASRRAAVLVCVMVCLLVVTALLANMMRSALRTQRRLKSEQALRQVEFLLDAGLSRAVHRLASGDRFERETWHPLRDAFGRGNHSAEVTIAVDRDSEGRPSIIHVTAEYPTGTQRSVRRTQHY